TQEEREGGRNYEDVKNPDSEVGEEKLLDKEAFNGLNADIESSKKKIVNLEQLLRNLQIRARKFEELSIQCSSDAESQTKRAWRLRKLMEVAKQSSTELEDLRPPCKKVVALEETELKVVHEVKTREAVEDSLKEQRNQVLALQEELTELKEDKNLQSKFSVLITSENELKAQLKEVENLLHLCWRSTPSLKLQLSVGEQNMLIPKRSWKSL
ncbi:hypothetical protein HPP92_027644, partial [Vanilla planifolia]